jgi:hypothetical protein
MMGVPGKVVYIHQPNFMPWLGFLEGLFVSDTYVVFDDIPFEQYGFQNRCKIKSPDGEIYLTVPVKQKFGELIKDKIISENYSPEKLLKSIYFNYKKTAYFEKYYPGLSLILSKKFDYMIDLNVELIFHLIGLLNKKINVRFSSELNIKSENKSDRVLQICKEVDCDRLCIGTGAKAYLNPELLEVNGIGLLYDAYELRHPAYKQNFNELGFIPFLSCIDFLFNCGEEEMRNSLAASGSTYFDHPEPNEL